MDKATLIEALKTALNTYEFDGEKDKAETLSTYITTLEAGARIDNTFKEGVIYALEYLGDLYDGLDETDIWADYMGEESN
jgi:hypothetical protein